MPAEALEIRRKDVAQGLLDLKDCHCIRVRVFLGQLWVTEMGPAGGSYNEEVNSK